jgi:hypothetical protein
MAENLTLPTQTITNKTIENLEINTKEVSIKLYIKTQSKI